MGGVPFMMWKLPTSAEDDNGDTDSDSTFYEPEDKSTDSGKITDNYTNSNCNLIYEGSSNVGGLKDNENNNFCLKKDMDLNSLPNITARNIANEYNTKLCSKQDTLRNFHNTKNQSRLENTINNEAKNIISNDYHAIINDSNKTEQNDHLSAIMFNSFSADEKYANNTKDFVFSETSDIKENSNYNSTNENKNTDENDSMNSIMTRLVSLFQNNVEDSVENSVEDSIHQNNSINTDASNDISLSFGRREDMNSESVHCDLQSSFTDRLVSADEQCMTTEFTGDATFTEHNITNYDSTLMNNNEILQGVNKDLECKKLINFSAPTEENINDLLLSNFDSETLNVYDQNIDFMLENDCFQDILKYQDFQEDIRTTEAAHNMWSSTTANRYSVQKRKWPNPKQWPKVRKHKAINCKNVERILPQRNCHSKLARNNRKVWSSADFIELSKRKGKGKKYEVNIQKQQHFPSNRYMTRSVNQQNQKEQPQRWKRKENKYTFKSVEDIKYLEKIKTALHVLSFRINQWTCGQDEHPPTRNEAVNMLQYVQRMHSNLQVKAKKCEDRKGKSHFLQVINDAEQLFFEIKNAIKEADRLFQMEQEQLSEMTDPSTETNLSDYIGETCTTKRTQPNSHETHSWLINTEQSQFINNNHILNKPVDKLEKNIGSNKTTIRKEWVASENDRVVSDLYCKQDVQLTALNNEMWTTRKTILKSILKKPENNKRKQKRLSFSDVVDYIPDGDTGTISSDDFSDKIEYVCHNRDTNNKNYVSDNTELTPHCDSFIGSKNGNSVQKKVINNHDATYVTENTINDSRPTCEHQTEDTTFKKQVNLNNKISNLKVKTENSNDKLHQLTFNFNQNHQHDHIKQHNNKNDISNICYQNIKNMSAKNNNILLNESCTTTSQNTGLAKCNTQTLDEVNMEVESDKSFNQYVNKCKQQIGKKHINKFNTDHDSGNNNTYIRSTDSNGTDDDCFVLFVTDKAAENGNKCSSKVRVSSVKCSSPKKKLNATHDNRKSNNINKQESGHKNNIQAAVSQNLSVASSTNVHSTKSMAEVQSRQHMTDFGCGNNTHLKSMFPLSRNKMTTDKPGKHNMVVTHIFPEKEQTNYKNLHEHDFRQVNINEKSHEINQVDNAWKWINQMEVDNAQSTVTLDCELEQLVVTDKKKMKKINKCKQQNNTLAVYINKKSKSDVGSSNMCLDNTIITKNIENQKIECNKGSEEDKMTSLLRMQQVKVTETNENHSIQNKRPTRPNSQVSNKSENISTCSNTTALYDTKNKSCANQNIDYYQEDKLITLNIPEQFNNINNSEENESNVSESQQFTLTNDFTFDDVCSSREQSIDDWSLVTIMDVKKVRIKHESEYIPSSEIIFNCDELFKDLTTWW